MRRGRVTSQVKFKLTLSRYAPQLSVRACALILSSWLLCSIASAFSLFWLIKPLRVYAVLADSTELVQTRLTYTLHNSLKIPPAFIYRSAAESERNKVSRLHPPYLLSFPSDGRWGGTARRRCIMQFGWLKENIKALPYWIWRHVQNRICAGHSLLLAGIKEITSSLSSPTHTQISSVRQALARRMSSGDLLNTLIPPSPSLPSQMQLLPTLNSEEKETEPSSGTIKRQKGSPSIYL